MRKKDELEKAKEILQSVEDDDFIISVAGGFDKYQGIVNTTVKAAVIAALEWVLGDTQPEEPSALSIDVRKIVSYRVNIGIREVLNHVTKPKPDHESDQERKEA